MDYSQYLASIFPGLKVQKISVNAGFSCPNRDGSIGVGGCSYCRNDSFSPSYCMKGDDVRAQIENGKKFFSRKYPDMKFLVYFQSYTNTYGLPRQQILKLYDDAISCKDVVGIVIATRPDTLDTVLIEDLRLINRKVPVFIEIGAETSCDRTLRIVNRGHTWRNVVDTVNRCSLSGLHCGLHLILGLPGEDEVQILTNVRNACNLPIETLKLHHLQILAGTKLYEQWSNGEIDVIPFELEDYLSLCVEITKLVPPHIIIERFLAQSPPQMVMAPKWGIKNYQFMQLLRNRLNNNRI